MELVASFPSQPLLGRKGSFVGKDKGFLWVVLSCDRGCGKCGTQPGASASPELHTILRDPRDIWPKSGVSAYVRTSPSAKPQENTT